ncbi:helix-turn-helix domain-containing protein [Micromonospora sp. WMMA1923]|uniref:helix-turn-helix domain-containing protein n=1 Tax=Micromonospora sp. WMMA1923 TaxID=3404125 RepID=UPI003B96246B
MARSPKAHPSCPRCGGRLARDNDSGRCAPCDTAERDRLSRPPVVPASFWQHGALRQALTERNLGRVIRAFRNHPYHGRNALPQSAVAGWLGITQAQLSRIENSPPIVHLDRLIHWAQLLRIPPRYLWFSLPDQPLPADNPPAAHPPADVPVTQAGPATPPAPADAVTTASDEGGGTTDRRQFHALAALAGIAATGSLDLLAAPTDAPRTIGLEQVRYASSLVDEFRRADAAVGANDLCDVAIRVHAHLSNWAAKATYSREVGEALHAALADLANQAAWLTIDAERRPETQPFLYEAISRSRMADDPRVEVQGLAMLSLLHREDRPGESLHCAEAALRASSGWATPRLLTLLHLRRANAYATLRDASGFNREITKARREFDRGSHEDDLSFIHFVTEQEVDGLQGLAYLALERPDRAAELFRLIATTPSPTLRRNHLLYTLEFANATYRQGDVNEAARTALGALPELRQMQSMRATRMFAQVRSDLGLPAHSTAATREFVEAYDQFVRR